MSDDISNERKRLAYERGEALVWALHEEGALSFFGLPPGTPVRLLQRGPQTEREKERYAPEANLYAIKVTEPFDIKE